MFIKRASIHPASGFTQLTEAELYAVGGGTTSKEVREGDGDPNGVGIGGIVGGPVFDLPEKIKWVH